jgi:hypothetical protein
MSRSIATNGHFQGEETVFFLRKEASRVNNSNKKMLLAAGQKNNQKH